jgi:hypothetical protein
MRFVTIILLTMLLGSCGKINTLKIAGEKVTNTVNAYTEAAKDLCNEDKASSVSNSDLSQQEGAETKASISWDTRMMLW